MSRLFEDFLKSAHIVGYSPMKDEVGYESFLSARGIPRADFLVSSSKDVLPEETAELLRKKYTGGNVALFMPGRRFDIQGTRHGRGHGWYDRLLSLLPPEWVRVGVLEEKLLSSQPLLRQSWDQPVDFLLILESSEHRVLETLARAHVLKF